MAKPSISDLKMWVGTLLTKDDWDFNFTKIVSWLANGESDLVANTIKATNGIDMDGSSITNLAPATTGSQAVNYDQALSLLNRTSFYKPYTVASGKVNSAGNAAYLQKDSDTQVTVLAGNVNPDLVIVQSDGTVESVTSNTVLTVGVADGNYNIVKEKGNNIIITTAKITVGKIFPTSPTTDDYFLNIAGAPYAGYKYNALTGWDATEFCYIGKVVVSGGVATVFPREYNENEYEPKEVPVGEIILYPKTTAPTGYLVCDGSAISRTTYADLFATIGTTFGGGDGSTTFNIPNLIDRVVKGASSLGADTTGGSTGNKNLNHSHTFAGVQYGAGGGSTSDALGDHNHTFSIDTFKLLPCIKY